MYHAWSIVGVQIQQTGMTMFSTKATCRGKTEASRLVPIPDFQRMLI